MIVFGSAEAQRIVEADRELVEQPERVCCVPGCTRPVDGLDDVHCQEHWEEYADNLWWTVFRQSVYVTAWHKNTKAGDRIPKVTQ